MCIGRGHIVKITSKCCKMFIQISLNCGHIILPLLYTDTYVRMYFNANKVEKLLASTARPLIPPAPPSNADQSQLRTGRTRLRWRRSRSRNRHPKKYISSWPKIHIVCIQPHTPNGCSINSTRTPQKDTEIQKYLARFQHFAYVTPPKADLAYVYTNNIVYIYIDIVNCPQQLSPPKIGTVVGTWNRSHCAVITSIICCLDKTLGDWEIL